MPRDTAGNYSLPAVYLAKTGDLITSVQHNQPLEDIAQALTGSLPRNGTAPMTGPLKLPDGDATAPALGFVSQPGLGLVRTATGLGVVVGSSVVLTITAGGLIAVPLGTPIPVLDDELPDLCLWADGRNISRTAYPALFAKWSTRYGAGNGSTTFGIPDLRGRGLTGRDNIGGTDAARLVGITFSGGTRVTTGATGGEARVSLSIAQMPAHAHPGSATASAGGHKHTIPNWGALVSGGFPGPGLVDAAGTKDTSTDGAHTHPLTIASQGDGAPHPNVPPTLLCNWAIFAGA